MNYKLTALTVAILAGLAVPALADRGMGDGPRGAGMGPRPSFADLDTNGDGALTLEEMTAKRTSMFTDADTDGNGELSIEELNASANANAQRNISEHTKKMMEKLDTDGNGSLSKTEIEARENSQGQGKGKDRGRNFEKMFDRVDANDDGKITEDEFAAMGERGHKGGERGGQGKWKGGSND